MSFQKGGEMLTGGGVREKGGKGRSGRQKRNENERGGHTVVTAAPALLR